MLLSVSFLFESERFQHIIKGGWKNSQIPKLCSSVSSYTSQWQGLQRADQEEEEKNKLN